MADDVTIKVMQDSPVTSALTLLLRIRVNLGSGLNAYPLSYLSDDSRFEAYCVCVCVYTYICVCVCVYTYIYAYIYTHTCDLCNDFSSAHYV